MNSAKIAITIDVKLLKAVDSLVAKGRFPNRSKAIQEAVREKVFRLGHHRLLKQLSFLDKREEQELADEVFKDEPVWPEY